MGLPVITLLMYRVVGESQGSGCHRKSFKRRYGYVGQILNIFNSNLGQLLMTKTKEKKQQLKLWFSTLLFFYRIGREKLSRCGQ